MRVIKLLAIGMGLLLLMTAVGCADTAPDAPDAVSSYEQITPEDAKALMDSETGYVILDVRTEEEFAAAHIEGAVLIPDYDIAALAPQMLTDKTQLILVYCRSGRRSKNAAAELASMGYGNVKEFGGINDWPYGTVTP